jgi:hypothetical protein
MGFGLAYLKRGLPLTAVLWMAAYPLQAQHGGQPIVFSSPASDDAVSPLPSLSSKLSVVPDLGDSAQVPLQFNFNGSSRVAPWPAVSSAAAARAQDLLDQRNNWLLLTPAEILGQTTPEKMMGIPERDAFGQRKYSSAMERYTARQNSALPSKTNALQMDYPSTWNFPGDRNSASNSINGGWGNPDKLADPLFNPAPDNQILSRQNGNGGWTKLFDQPVQPSVSSPAQLTDMDRFRQMLNSSSPATTPSTAPAVDGIKTSLPQTLLGSGLAQPQPARIGASYVPLNSGIGKPADLPKLSGAWSLNYTSAPPAAAWAPQVAPWLSPAPQPFAVPQRKF